MVNGLNLGVGILLFITMYHQLRNEQYYWALASGLVAVGNFYFI